MCAETPKSVLSYGVDEVESSMELESGEGESSMELESDDPPDLTQWAHALVGRLIVCIF